MKIKIRRIRTVALITWCIVMGAAGNSFCFFDFGPKPEIVIYCDVDKSVSEPIFQRFEEQYKIKTEVHYAAKSNNQVQSLSGRISSERKMPKGDVFWDRQFEGTTSLAREGLLMPYYSPESAAIPDQFKDKSFYWSSVGGRVDGLIYNPNELVEEELPRSIVDLQEPQWFEVFAFTALQNSDFNFFIEAINLKIGKRPTEKFLEGLGKNRAGSVDNDSRARKLVADGTVLLAFVNLNSPAMMVNDSTPIKIFNSDQDEIGSLFIPSTVALVNRCPHPEKGKLLIDYLLSKEVSLLLAGSSLAFTPVREDVDPPPMVPDGNAMNIMKIDYNFVPRLSGKTSRLLRELNDHKR